MGIITKSILWITVILVSSCRQIKAQCNPGEAEENGKCYYTTTLSRNILLEFYWVYDNVNPQPLTVALEDHIKADLLTKFVTVNTIAESMNLGRSFCPSGDCSSIVITLSDLGVGSVLAQFHAEGVHRILSDGGPYALTIEFLNDAYNQGSFDLQASGELLTSVEATEYNMTWSYYCLPGQELVKVDQFSYVCGACLPGQYANDSTGGICTPCAIGSYQPAHSQTFCYVCPYGFSNKQTGELTEDTCEVQLICPEGQFAQFETECVVCPIGSYKSGSGPQTQCTACEFGEVTYSVGAITRDQCLVKCSEGYALSLDGVCSICSVGTYLTNPAIERECIQCPNNLTTDGAGSNDVTLCRNIICDAGYIRQGANPGECVHCPENTFRTAEMTLCTTCGDPSKWRTDITGAPSQDYCKFYCQGGMFVSDLACTDCPQDTYKGNDEYYSEACHICPIDRPKTFAAKSTTIDDCQYARCSRGQEISQTSTLVCVDCNYGYYQMFDEPITEECIKCPDKQSTLNKASTSINDCRSYCESGQELIDNICSICPIGTYKNNNDGLFGNCQPCPIEMVTANSGSTSASDCNVKNCSAGYKVASGNLCEKCPRGTYQNARYQTTCITCPDPESTTAQEGATSASDCNVYLDRTRLAFKIKFDIIWENQYWNHATTEYKGIETRILKQVNRTLMQVEAYRQGLKIITLVQGSVSAHLIAKFYKNNPNLKTDFERELNGAIANGQISSATVDGYLPLPVDNRLQNIFEYSEKPDGDPDVCPYGYYFDYSAASCEMCPIGTYQPDGIGDVCLNCPQGQTTTSTGMFGTAEVCLLVCAAGRQQTNGVCEQCPIGSYKSSESVFDCVHCGTGQITTRIGATSTDQCLAECPPGQYSTTSKTCSLCPLNEYNPLDNQVECLQCPLNLRTTVKGATNQSECRDPCDIDQPCLNGATCSWSVTDNGFNCVCTAEYIGNRCQTTVDVCSKNQPCLNSGTCIVVPSTGYRCTCQEEYEGDNCETPVVSPVTDPEAPSGNVMYIAIGASVGVLVIVALIVIVTVCLCRKKPDKKQKTPLPIVNGNTMNNNNTYAMTTPHSTVPKSFAPHIPATLTRPSVVQEAPASSPLPAPPSSLSSIPTEYLPPVPPKPQGLGRETSPTRESLNVTTVSMTSSNEQISQRTLNPPESPTSKRSRDRERRKSSGGNRNKSPARLRREPVIEETQSSMPPMSNPLLEPPIDYPLDLASESRISDDSIQMKWEENGLQPPPYSKKDPHNKKYNKRIKAKSSKKHVTIDTDRNMVHNMSLRSNASSNHTYMDIDENNINLQNPVNSRVMPSSYPNGRFPIHGNMTRVNSPFYEALN